MSKIHPHSKEAMLPYGNGLYFLLGAF